MDDPMWSRHFARQIAQTLGYQLPDAPVGSGSIDFDPVADAIVQELTETFRFLPPEQIQCALDFAGYLRANEINGRHTAPEHLRSWVPIKLQEVRDLSLMLRQRYGTDEPADEKDYWTEQDERDLTANSLRVWDEREAAGEA
jgi:hypothetical protein